MRNGDDICPRDCPERTEICHSKCKRYLDCWNTQRKAGEENLKKRVVDAYIVDTSRALPDRRRRLGGRVRAANKRG